MNLSFFVLFSKDFVSATQSCLGGVLEVTQPFNDQKTQPAVIIQGPNMPFTCVHWVQQAYPAHRNFIFELFLELTNFKYVLFGSLSVKDICISGLIYFWMPNLNFKFWMDFNVALVVDRNILLAPASK